MLDNIKLLLGITDDSQDALISLLIDMAQTEAITFCHLDEYDAALDNIVFKMVIQMYNKVGNEGLTSSNIGGVMSEQYLTDYSYDILTQLKRHRKLVTI